MVQCAQLEPQEDFPLRLLRTSDRMIAATISTSTALIKIVDPFAESHSIMISNSLSNELRLV